LIVIMAASGQLGRLVIENLSGHTDVIAAVRDPARAAADARHADFTDPASMRTAFKGATKLLLISSPELDAAKRIGHHLAAVDAARAAKVGAIAYTSFLGAGTTATGVTEAHHATERAIRDSGLPYTFLRHPYYSDAFVPRITDGELTASTAGRGLNTAFRADLAEAAANVLLGDGHEGKAYDFTGPLWRHHEVAEAAGVPFREVPDAGPGPMAWLNAQVRAGAMEFQSPDLERVLCRPAESMTVRFGRQGHGEPGAEPVV
jgi:NAD(P)H dehydrogenase (quinone)